MVAFDKE